MTKTEYVELHRRMRRTVPRPESCPCGFVGPLDLCNKSGDYTEDTSDWMYLCRPCHRKHDRPQHCRRGHTMPPIGRCQECKRISRRADYARIKADPVRWAHKQQLNREAAARRYGGD